MDGINPKFYRQYKDQQQVLDLLTNFRYISRSRYLYSMIYSEVAVQNGYQIKMYLDVLVLSSSIVFKNNYKKRILID